MFSSKIFTKVLVVLSLVLVFMVGANYRPKQDYDYSQIKALEVADGATKVDFKFLGGFDYEENQEIPEPVNRLNGRVVEIEGFMLPVDFDEGKVNSFLLMNSRMACCFGVMPRINEFVYVEMPKGKSTKFMTDIPISVSGRLEIGEDNLVGGLYTLEASKVEKVKNL